MAAICPFWTARAGEQELVDQTGGSDGEASVLSVIVNGSRGGVERTKRPRSGIVFVDCAQRVNRCAGRSGNGRTFGLGDEEITQHVG